MRSLLLGWRNLWRNGRRTAISLAAIASATLIITVTLSLVEGSSARMRHMATHLGVAEVEVHHPTYLKERSLYASVPGGLDLVATLRGDGLAATARAIGYGLVARGPRSAGVQLLGVDAGGEAQVGELPSHLSAGRFVSPGDGREVVLGARLARSLGAAPGDEVVVVVQAADGSTGNEMFRVVGVLKPIGDAIDRAAALIPLPAWGALYALPDGVHEVLVSSSGRRTAEALAARVQAAAPGLEVKTWTQLMPSLANLLWLLGVISVIITGAFVVAGGLGVLNTLLMATFERIPEFGLLKALGTTPRQIVRMVAAEALVLALVGAGAGAAMGCGLSLVLTEHGIDVSGFGADTMTLGGMAADPVMRASLTLYTGLLPPAVLVISTLLASLYPAIRAGRLDPVEAMNHV